MKKYQIKVDDPMPSFSERKGLVGIGASFDIQPDDLSINIKPAAIDEDRLKGFASLGLKGLGVVVCYGLLRFHYYFLLSISRKPFDYMLLKKHPIKKKLNGVKPP